MRRGYVLVEGHGETRAIENLVNRLWRDLSLPATNWRVAHRCNSLYRKADLQKRCEAIRLMREVDALLVTRDEDDACPRETAPAQAEWIRELQLPFPAALLLFHREYEALFLPCIEQMAGRELSPGRPGLLATARWEGDYESLRGVKGWLTRNMPPGVAYKPALDQLAMTRMVDFEVLRGSGLPCFGTLERALQFLASESGGVYPPPA